MVKSTQSDLGTYVALLRGINVGGKNKLPMADLSAIFSSLGAKEVKTYIQSGNVVFRAEARLAASMAVAVAKAISERHGFSSPVVLRSAEELHAARDGNPFLKAGEDPESLHVAFLGDSPADEAARSLDPNRSPGDRFIVQGKEVYLHVPNGVARTKLTNAWLDAKLDTVSTLRNWKTVTALCDLAREIAST